MSRIMDHFAYFLQSVGYRSVVGFPYLTTYLHLLVSAILPIYTGAHASLSRPPSAAKPSKNIQKRDQDDEPEEHEQTMEGLGLLDALFLPLSAAVLLTGLYYLIKWLEDPTMLNKILNWYFAAFGTLSLARMFTDTMGVFTSVIFPKIYKMNGNTWEIDAKHRKSQLHVVSSPSVEQHSEVPEASSAPPLPPKITNTMWILRELPSRQLHVRVYIHKVVQTRFKIGPQGITSLFLAIAAVLYFNLIGKPWWLTNLLGFSFAYSTLQIMSPTSSSIGTLILGALFVYDIYFVFFTPLMVTVATQLDIPAKLLFPRPSRPTDDPTKQALAMLGLGDVILPGMMIGFALRFDLYLFYLRKQTRQTSKGSKNTTEAANAAASKKVDDSDVAKATWYPATGGWGERFWAPKNDILKSERFQGVVFPKTYFRASIIGYFFAMLCTLVIMDLYGHAQPALLYLVPGVLGSLWGTALIKGDIKTLWKFDEFEDDEKTTLASNTEKQESVWNKDSWMNVDWKSLFLSQGTLNSSENSKAHTRYNNADDHFGEGDSNRFKRSRKSLEDSEKSRSTHGESLSSQSSDHEPQGSKHRQPSYNRHGKASGVFDRNRKSELVFISVNLPEATPTTPSKATPIPEQASSSAHVAHRTRAKTTVEERSDDGL